MRSSNWTPSIVPGQDQDVCLVIDDLGKLGLIYCESDVETAHVENVVEDLLDGQYSNPVRVICFNVAEGWSLDISADVAAELRRRCDLQVRDCAVIAPDGFVRLTGPALGCPHACGCDAAGMPCPVCNPADGLTPPSLPSGYVDDDDSGTRRH